VLTVGEIAEEGGAMAGRKSVIPLTVRVRQPLHEKLLRAAKAKDISLSEEIEQRVIDSFDLPDRWRAAWEKDRKSWAMFLKMAVRLQPENRAKIAADIDALLAEWEKSPAGVGL
jgi:hypothetical protein